MLVKLLNVENHFALDQEAGKVKEALPLDADGNVKIMEEIKSAALRKISAACKSAAKRKFKVWPSAYASGWGVRCTRAGGPGKFGGGKKKK